MQAIKIKYNQTNVDVAMLAFGTLERLFELPNIANGGSVTDDLVAEDVISGIADFAFDKKSEVRVLNRVEHLPASVKMSSVLSLEGIDYWAIGTEFIIK